MAVQLENCEMSANKRPWEETVGQERPGTRPGDSFGSDVYPRSIKRSKDGTSGEAHCDNYRHLNGDLQFVKPGQTANQNNGNEQVTGDSHTTDNRDPNNQILNGHTADYLINTNSRPPDFPKLETISDENINFENGNDDQLPTNLANGYHEKLSGMNSTDSTSSSSDSSNSEKETNHKGDGSDDDDNASDISELSGISIEAWRPIAGPISWVQEQMMSGTDPRKVLKELVPQEVEIPIELDDYTLWKLVINILSEPPKRKKLSHVNTMEDVIKRIKTANNIVVLTGAGVSVSCGIPDFRSRDGIYARLSVEYPDLPDPQAMFDINFFQKDPRPFFKFAKEIYPGQFQPSTSHKFIRLLEDHNKLLRNYTQNIDTLEQVAGIHHVIQCHGSFATARCRVCQYKVDADAIKEDIMNQLIPRCPKCGPDVEKGIMKPDIVFFGESLPAEFHRQIDIDKDVCDLLIVIGSSLKVRPVALIPNSLPANIPQVLINREPLKHLNFDVELLGDCDVILNELCHRLGPEWNSVCTRPQTSIQMTKDELSTPPLSSQASPSAQDMSEDNSHMSLQPMSEDNSRMSLQQDGDSATLPAASQDIQCLPVRTNCGSVQNQATECVANRTACTQTSDCGGRIDVDSVESRQDSIHTGGTTPPTQDCIHSEGGTPPTLNSIHNEGATPPAQDCIHSEGDMPLASLGKTSSDSSEQPSGNDIDDFDMQVAEHALADLEVLRACWQPRRKRTLAARLRENTHLFLPPNRYVFQGAEVYSDDESDYNDDDDLSKSSTHDDDDRRALDDLGDDTQDSFLSTPEPGEQKPDSKMDMSEGDSSSLDQIN